MLVCNFGLEMFPVPLKRSSDAFRCFSDCVHMQPVSWQTLHSCRRAFGQNKFCWVYSSFVMHASPSHAAAGLRASCNMSSCPPKTSATARLSHRRKVGQHGFKELSAFLLHACKVFKWCSWIACINATCLHDRPKCRQESWAPWRSQIQLILGESLSNARPEADVLVIVGCLCFLLSPLRSGQQLIRLHAQFR